jgi:hypothetical protein
MASMHNNDPHLYINACQNGSIREDGGGHVVTYTTNFKKAATWFFLVTALIKCGSSLPLTT